MCDRWWTQKKRPTPLDAVLRMHILTLMKTTTMDAMVKATAKQLNVRKLSAEQLRFVRDDATAAVESTGTFAGKCDKYVLQALACQQELARRGV